MNTVAVGVRVEVASGRLTSTLAAMRDRTARRDVQVFLLPDSPAENASSLAPEFPEAAQLVVPAAGGSAAGFNRLAQASAADVIVLLESDARVGPGWLELLLAALRADPRNGLAGPSTNRSWNAQGLFPTAGGTDAEIARCAQEALRRFGNTTRTLEPLYSLADFCYVARREVIEEVGLADEGYGRGPCWEMDYNIRAARAGWRGVWACGAYVYRAPLSERRRQEEARLLAASKHRYQDKFCGARLRGEKSHYRVHCRGDACPNFAPPILLRAAPPQRPPETGVEMVTHSAPHVELVTASPLVSCIMPTCDRLQFVPGAVRCFLQQDYPQVELIIVDDGTAPVASVLPEDPRLRLIRLTEKKNIGAKRNLACAAARGQFILHWDDDDWYPPDRVRRQMAALQSGSAEICGTSTLFYYEPNTGRTWCYRYGSGGRAWVAGNTLAYRKSWWVAHPFPEIQVGEDTRFVWTAGAAQIHDLASPGLCVARVHPGNTSRKQTHSACWQPRGSAELHSLLGADWPEFAGSPGADASEPSRPLVSCIMPTFNRRAFVPLALQAFLAQDYPHRELIVVDDGEDQVSDLVRNLAGVRRVALSRRTTIGRKRNLACEAARGSIIAHWDDDDWHGPRRLSHQVAPLLAGRAELTGLESAFQLDLLSGQFWRPNADLHRRMFVGDVHGGTLVFWRRLFDAGLRYPDANLAEDAWLIRQAQLHGHRLIRLDNPGVFVYMRHGSNSWRFQAGRFLDANGWEQIEGPTDFPVETLAAYRAALAG